MKKILAALLAAALLTCLCTAFAADPSASGWAQDSLDQAIALGFVPEDLQSAYQQDITRGEFAAIAMQFLAAQYGYDVENFYFALTWRSAQNPDAPQLESPFVDGVSEHVDWAYSLGVVNGRMMTEDETGFKRGTFDPDAPITRQEAAAMLCRAYAVYGGSLEDAAGPSFADTFTDAGQVAGWALDSAEAMWALGVMGGTGDGLFSPLGLYTREQCIVTVLRLWQSGPVSRARENVPALEGPTQAEAVKAVEEGIVNFRAPYNVLPFHVLERWDTKLCVVLYGEYGGLPHPVGPNLILVYPDGTVQRINDGIPPAGVWGTAPNLENLTLSQDGTTLTYSVTYTDRLEVDGAVFHEPGIYHVTLDLATGAATLTVTPLNP